MRVAQLIALVCTMAIAAAGCTRARASVEPELPILQPPPPPPRMVETYLDARPLTTDPEMVVETAAAIPPNKPLPRPAAPKPEVGEKPPPPPVEAERTAPAPALTLKPSPGSEAKTVASIRDLLSKASRDLNRVNYAALDADGRVQWATARRFMEQSEAELKNGNVGFAGKLADKAATMAAVLVR